MNEYLETPNPRGQTTQEDGSSEIPFPKMHAISIINSNSNV